MLHPAGEGHPWPAVLSPGALGGRFTGAREPVRLTLVEPVAAEVSADVVLSYGSFRHLVRFVRSSAGARCRRTSGVDVGERSGSLQLRGREATVDSIIRLSGWRNPDPE